MIVREDTTYYHIGGMVRLYLKGEEAPGYGWQAEPWPGVELKPEPLDHDANGKAGGSLPKRRGRPPKS